MLGAFSLEIARRSPTRIARQDGTPAFCANFMPDGSLDIVWEDECKFTNYHPKNFPDLRIV